jgi:ABC-type glycerol-3-phosphate transport system substrate-binding protein
MYNFITQYAPKMEWGAAPFPTADPKLYGMSDADLDVIAIPRDAKHPDESFEFIKYVMSQPAMEKLCMGHRKFSPLTKVSPAFWTSHPNPYIKLFDTLARNSLTFALPHLTFWQEYSEEMNVAFQKVYLLEATPEAALAEVKTRMQKRLDRELRRFKRLGLSTQ